MDDGTPGQNGICDLSGFKYPMSELVRQWDGAWVHWRFKDKRNPQDHLRAKPDNQRPSRSRPEAEDTFITTPVLASDL